MAGQSVESAAWHRGHVARPAPAMGSASVKGGREVVSSQMRRFSRKLTQDRWILQSRGSATLPEHAGFCRALTRYALHCLPRASILSRAMTYKIKRDAYVGRFCIIDFSAERLAGEIDRVLDPVEGTITYDRSELRRHP
jgi:hypothetical protein